MLEFACTMQELSCIVGTLFTELEPPCKRCGLADELTICGTTYTGKQAVLVVTKHGFKYDGDAADVERIREKRCLIGTATATGRSV